MGSVCGLPVGHKFQSKPRREAKESFCGLIATPTSCVFCLAALRDLAGIALLALGYEALSSSVVPLRRVHGFFVSWLHCTTHNGGTPAYKILTYIDLFFKVGFPSNRSALFERSVSRAIHAILYQYLKHWRRKCGQRENLCIQREKRTPAVSHETRRGYRRGS